MKRFCSVRLGKGPLCLLWLHIPERTMTNLSERHIGMVENQQDGRGKSQLLLAYPRLRHSKRQYLCFACTTATAIQSQDTINRLTPPGNRRESRSNRVESNVSLNGWILRPGPTISIAAPHPKHPSASKISSSWSQGQPNSLPSTSCGPQNKTTRRDRGGNEVES